jgi:ATP-dependent DNA helicase RecQ
MLALHDCEELTDTPDRTNIKLHVHRFKASLHLRDLFQWVVDCLLVHKAQCSRIMIFCRSIDDCGKLYTMFRCALDESLHHHVNMYHSNTLDYVKEFVQTDMCNPQGNIRVLICTSAAGMGVNFSAVYHVVHYGPPYSIDSLIQQMGRAGRDGCDSHHLLANVQQ